MAAQTNGTELLPRCFTVTTVQKKQAEKTTCFKSLITPLCTLNTKPELTYFLTHLRLFTNLNDPTDINVFKNGINPLWEDEANLVGGKYIIKVKKQVGQRLFERLVAFFTLYDKTEDGNYANPNVRYANDFPKFLKDVNGIVGSLRGKQVMLSVWMRIVPEDKEEVVKEIRKVLGVEYELLVEFKDNDESLKDNSSFRNTAVYGSKEVSQ